MKELNDGCANVHCKMHGFLARAICNFGEVYCHKCGKWIRALSDEEKHKIEVRQARNQRFRGKQTNQQFRQAESYR